MSVLGGSITMEKINVKSVLNLFKRKIKEVYKYEEIMCDCINYFNDGLDDELDADGERFFGGREG